jgi:hypothetical protein
MEAEGTMNPVKLPSVIVSLLLAIGAALTLLFAGWMIFAHPLRPTTVNVPQIVEKVIPCPACPVCPPTRTGNGSTKGNGSPVVTGNGNSTGVNTNPPPLPKKE